MWALAVRIACSVASSPEFVNLVIFAHGTCCFIFFAIFVSIWFGVPYVVVPFWSSCFLIAFVTAGCPCPRIRGP